MTVAELIERLRGLDGNLTVCGSDYEEGIYPLSGVGLDDWSGQLRVILS